MFRSRNEARWAVFFTELKIEFQFEPEGFILPTKEWYLPDFFLPQINFFAEAKGQAFTDSEHSKCRELMKSNNKNCLFLVSPPDFKTYVGTGWDCDEYTETDYLLDIDYHGRKFYDKQRRLYGCTDGSWNNGRQSTYQDRSASEHEAWHPAPSQNVRSR